MPDEAKHFVIHDALRVGLGRGFKFEAGHILPGYDGKCATPHGHSYFGKILVSAPRGARDAQGIVLDFDVLKAAIKDTVFLNYDHTTIVGKTAEDLVYDIATNLQSWFSLFAGQTRDLPDASGSKKRRVTPDVVVERVLLHETADSFAEYRRGGF